MKVLFRIFIVFFFFVTFFIPSAVHASEAIQDFNVEIVAHKDGVLTITETIKYDFGQDQRHGIYRKIPLVSRVGDLYRVLEIDFQDVLRNAQEEEYSQTINTSEATVKIGKADTTIQGVHEYKIVYSVTNAIGSNYDDHDELYWNSTGNEWNVPILRASVVLTTDFGILPDKVVCYTGSSGSAARDCRNDNNFTITTENLGAQQGLTAVWNFPKNTFPPSKLQENPPTNMTYNSGIAKFFLIALFAIPIFLNFIAAPLTLLWYFKTKRKNRFGPAVVNFDMPEDSKGKRITPAEAGSIDTHYVDQNDIIATIFDLAIRKYLKMEEVKKKKILGIFGDSNDYIFTKLKDADNTMTAFEQELFKKLFEEKDTVELSSLQSDFYKTFQTIEKKIFESLIERGFYTKNPKVQIGMLIASGIFSIFSGGYFLAIVLLYLSRKLNGRTSVGDETDWKIDGLKIFLKSMKDNHTWQAKNLYIVEQLIPYAIAFGYIKEFMEQLQTLYPDYNPTWYNGNTPFYLATNSMYNSMSNSFTTHAPSSSSGFSSGSSGGGGGGGGGGSW